jgi:hypothetical protein
MLRSGKVTLFAAVLCLVFTAGIFGQAPNTLMYHGKLTDATGPISDPVNVTFRIYEADAGGTAIWTEAHTGLTPNEMGIFTVQLGSITPFTLGVFDGSVRYLGITVGADDEMVPRQEITSAPYAMRTGDMPGVANYERETTFWYYPGTGVSTMDSIDITIPAAGYVEITGSCFLNVANLAVTQEHWFLISKTPDAVSFSYEGGIQVIRVPSSQSGNWAFPITTSRLYEETAGTHRYYFNTYFLGSGTPNVGKIYLRATYYSRAYGAIEFIPEPLLKVTSQNNTEGIDGQ